MLAYLRYRDEPTHRRLAELTLTGLVSFGFSFTSIFVLAAIGMAHVAHVAIARRAGERAPRWARGDPVFKEIRTAPGPSSPKSGMTDFAWYLVANVLLVAAFAVVYTTFHANAQGDKLLKDYFVDAWAPLSAPLSLPGWLARQTRVLGEIAGASSFAAFALLLAAGAWCETRNGRSPTDATMTRSPRGPSSSSGSLPLITMVLVASLAMILFASALHLYPYGSARLTVFLAPLVCALAAAGMLEALGVGAAAAGRQGAWRVMAVTGLLYVLMYPAISESRVYLSHGWGTDELGRNIAALARTHSPGEGIYVPERAASSFVYYWWRSGKGTDDADVVWGERHRLHPKDHAEQIAKIAEAHPSLWVIFDDQSREERETLRGLLLERYESVRRDGERDAESVELFRRRAPA
jgi:hypothetical protein